MTPEVAEYYRAMLLVGIRDKFDGAFDHALETEEPLSDLVLSLSTCISDNNQVLSVLRDYTLNCAINEQTVYDLVLEDLRGRLLAGEMTRSDLVGLLYRIVQNLDKFWDEPWVGIMRISADLELFEAGIISEEVFNQCFDAWLYHAEQLDAVAIQRQLNAKNRKRRLLAFFKK